MKWKWKWGKIETLKLKVDNEVEVGGLAKKHEMFLAASGASISSMCDGGRHGADGSVEDSSGEVRQGSARTYWKRGKGGATPVAERHV